MINPSSTNHLSPHLNLPKSNSSSSIATPRLSGLPSLSNTPANKESSNTPINLKRNPQTSHSNTPRSSTRDTTAISKPPIEAIHNEHFSNSHKEHMLTSLNKVRIKGSVPKLNLKGYLTTQGPLSSATERSKSPPKLFSFKDKTQSSSARSLKGILSPKDRSGSNPNPQDIAVALRFSTAQNPQENRSQKILDAKSIADVKEQQSLDGIKFSRNSSRQGSRLNAKLKTTVTIKKVGSKQNGQFSSKLDKLPPKWLSPDIVELANICLPPSTTGFSTSKSEKIGLYAKSQRQHTTSPVSQLSDRSSLFSRNKQREKIEEKDLEIVPNSVLGIRSNSVPYHLPQKPLGSYFNTEHNNMMSPSLQEDITTRSYNPAEFFYTFDEKLYNEDALRKDRKSLTFIKKSDSPYESGSQSHRISVSPIPNLNLAMVRMIKQGEVVKPSTFRKTQETSIFHIEKRNLTEGVDDDFENIEDNNEDDYTQDYDHHNKNRNIFNKSEFGYFEVNSDNEFIKEYIEGTGPQSTISKDFLKQLQKGKLPTNKDDQMPLVVNTDDRQDNIIIQPKFMQQYGSMNFTELWSRQRKKEYLKEKKNEVQIRKIGPGEAAETIFRPGKKQTKLFVQNRIMANRGDFSIHNPEFQEQIKTVASRIVKKQKETGESGSFIMENR